MSGMWMGRWVKRVHTHAYTGSDTETHGQTQAHWHQADMQAGSQKAPSLPSTGPAQGCRKRAISSEKMDSGV